MDRTQSRFHGNRHLSDVAAPSHRSARAPLWFLLPCLRVSQPRCSGPGAARRHSFLRERASAFSPTCAFRGVEAPPGCSCKGEYVSLLQLQSYQEERIKRETSIKQKLPVQCQCFAFYFSPFHINSLKDTTNRIRELSVEGRNMLKTKINKYHAKYFLKTQKLTRTLVFILIIKLN